MINLSCEVSLLTKNYLILEDFCVFDPPGSLLELDTVKLCASLGQTLQQPFFFWGRGQIPQYSPPPQGLIIVICNQVL